MPVYSLPAADVETAVTTATGASDAVRQARAALECWHASPDGQKIDAAVADGSITMDDALFGSPLGMHTRDLEKAITAVRQRVEKAHTIITPREVTAALRAVWPHCYLSSRDAGDGLIEVALPHHAAGLLYSTGDNFNRAEELLRSLLHCTVRIAGFHGATRDDIKCTVFTFAFPLPGAK